MMCPNCHGEARVWHDGVGTPEPCPECAGTGQVDSTPLLSEQITALRDQREKIAAIGQTLSERELSARLLRLELETELRQAGSTKTDAEAGARVSARYLDFARLTIQREFDRAIAEAEAESILLAIRLQLATLERIGIRG